MQNKGKWYVQVTIPPELRPLFRGNKQKKLSTGTSDLSIARRHQHKKSAEIYAQFDAAKPNNVLELMELLRPPERIWEQAVESGVTSDLIPTLETLAENIASMTGDEEEDCYRDFVSRKALKILADLRSSTEPSIKLSAARDRWLATTPYPVAKTAKEAFTAIDEYIAHAGDPAISSLSKHAGYEYAEYLAESGKSNSTIKKKLGYLSKCLSHCERKGLIETNSLSGISLSGYGSKKEHWKSFVDGELSKLFALTMDDHLRLLLSILVTTGMRLDEAALLDWNDIKIVDGILHFDLTGRDKVLKNIGSARKVPVHDCLLNSLKPNGRTGQIFPQFKRNPDGKAQGPASKALMPLIRQVTVDPQKVVHSLRGTLKDKMRDADVSKEVNDFITGHSSGDVAGTYGAGPSLKVRQTAINKVEHPWLRSG